jgi:hypothetical protein
LRVRKKKRTKRNFVEIGLLFSIPLFQIAMISAANETERQQGFEVVIDDTLASPSRTICIAVDESEFSQYGSFYFL